MSVSVSFSNTLFAYCNCYHLSISLGCNLLLFHDITSDIIDKIMIS
jgi:hypothetical protein